MPKKFKITKLAPLLDGPKSRADVGLTYNHTQRAIKAGILKERTERVRVPRRGRPAHLYALTDKGRKRVKRAVAA